MQQTRRGKSFKDLVQEAKSRIQETTPEDVAQMKERGEKFVIIDVREPEDYHKGHIEGAVSVPRGLLELEIDELVPDQDMKLVAYCGGGSRSALAADTLRVMGYGNVYSMAGGWKAWSQR